MYYYHLRYNIYPAPGYPIEKEEWIGYPEHFDETELNKMLQERHNTPISIIHCSLICAEAFFEQIEKQLRHKAAPLN